MVFEARLKTEFWVKALIRTCSFQNVPAMVLRKGDETAGMALLKVNYMDGRAVIYAPIFTLEGSRSWHRATGPDPVDEGEADAYIKRAAARDPDIWAIEIEDPQGRHFLTDPVEE